MLIERFVYIQLLGCRLLNGSGGCGSIAQEMPSTIWRRRPARRTCLSHAQRSHTGPAAEFRRSSSKRAERKISCRNGRFCRCCKQSPSQLLNGGRRRKTNEVRVGTRPPANDRR